MLKTTFLVIFAIGTALGDGDFIVLQSPNSVHFNGTQPINQSLLKEVFTAILGYTVKPSQPWDGVTIIDPFELPEAVVSIAIEGVESLQSLESPGRKRFPLTVDEVEESTWQAVSRRLEERDNNNTLVRICVGDGLNALGQSALGELKPNPIDESFLKHLNLTNDRDRKFLEELQLLRAIAQKIPSTITANLKPDVYWFVVSGLQPLMDEHGKDSAASKEALNLLNDTLNDVSQAFVDIYNGQVVIAVFTNDAKKLRDTRSVESRGRRQERAVDENSDAATSESVTEVISSTQTFEKNEEEITDRVETTTAKELEETEITTQDDKIDKTTSETTDNDFNERKHEIHSQTSDENDILKTEPVVLKLALRYGRDYPVIFNILLWFGIVFAFSLLAICIAIADMDPGRDSIIYRMTSNRMKKDN